MTIAAVDDVRSVVDTDRSDAQLQSLLDRVEAQIEAELGTLQTEGGSLSVTETHYPKAADVFLKQPVQAITSVTEDDTLLDADDYRLHAAQGRLERLPVGAHWTDDVVVVYEPADRTALVKEVEIGLVRLELAHTGFKSESVAGEYSYQAEDYEVERKKLMKRLRFTSY
jgi:hypothetical protein